MLSLLLGAAALLLALPAFALLLLTLAARAAERQPATPEAAAPQAIDTTATRLAVLVPAHDEAAHIGATLRALQRQLGPADRLLVVADNCSDATAAQARAAGAEVLERHDPQRRGKGYALAHGVAHLRAAPPEVVLVVDADCRLSPGAARRAADECRHLGRPVQMLDLMRAPAGAGLGLRTVEFAMRVKNLVRPLGSTRLGDACHLMGTGMALPWPLLAAAPLASGHVAEDMALGLALTCAGRAPRFLPQVQVSSRFATEARATRAQKTRWEHGHLQSIGEHLAPLLATALRQRRRAPLVLALDLMIPPLALYVLLLGAATLGLLALLALAPALGHPLLPALGLLGAADAALAAALGLAWWRWGRDLLAGPELLSLPLYALRKLPIYLAYGLGRRSAWVRGGRPNPRRAP